jgi:HEPN domain-containing protein
VKHDLEFKKIHDLLVLLDICQKKDGKFSCLIEDCQFLNTLYIDTRYPVNWPADVTKEEAIKAKESAQRIKEFVEKLLLLDGQV